MTERLTVPVAFGQSTCPVTIGQGVLGDPAVWAPHLTGGAVMIVSNEVVAPLYAGTVRAALGPAVDADLYLLADGEAHKTVTAWSAILDRLVTIGARRDALLITLGGGVVGDIGGFAAATYMRGIRFVQAPTTLLAQVDAAVGGKTGVNHPRGKNLIGAFHSPAAVVADTATLASLPEREFRAGMAEVVKYGAIRDAALLEWMEASAGPIRRRDPAALGHLIATSVRHKAEVVGADPFESGLRAILNFGHTFAHALESATNYAVFLHGEAVAIGMVCAARLSERRGLCPPGTAGRLVGLLDALGLPWRVPAEIPTRSLLAAMALDKKARARGLRLILLESAGCAVIDEDSDATDIIGAIEASRAQAAIA